MNFYLSQYKEGKKLHVFREGIPPNKLNTRMSYTNKLSLRRSTIDLTTEVVKN